MKRDDLREVIARAMAHHNEEAIDKYYLEEADAILSALDAAGMKCVPMEPTEAMIEAGDYAWFSDYGPEAAYRAMIAVEG